MKRRLVLAIAGVAAAAVAMFALPLAVVLERSYRDLWKFYVFADTSDAALLKKVQEIAASEFGDAVNVYDASAR